MAKQTHKGKADTQRLAVAAVAVDKMYTSEPNIVVMIQHNLPAAVAKREIPHSHSTKI